MDQRNLVLAIVLSIGILIGFELLFAKFGPPPPPSPHRPAPTATQSAPAATKPNTAAAPNAAAPAAKPAITPQTAAAAVAGEPRLRIENPELSGSISLKGARINNLKLTQYHETVDPKSPQVQLLWPTGTGQPYFGQFGWIAATPGTVKVPGPDTLWKAPDETLTPSHPVTMTWDNGAGLVFTRTISLDKDYMFRIEDKVRNDTGAPVKLTPYALINRTGTPKARGYSSWAAYQGMIGEFGGSLKEVKYSSLKPGQPATFTSDAAWLGFSEEYWLTALIPPQQQQIKAQFRIGEENGTQHFQADFLGSEVTVPAHGTTDYTTRFFAGAKELSVLDRYADSGIHNFDRAVDFGFLYFLSKPIFHVLEFFNQILGNFGLAILLFTFLVKLLFFPLANKSYRAMSKMKLLQPEMQKIRERFPDDKARQQQEIMAMYKRVGANPMAGCLPIVVQIPVFWALYEVLYVTIEMRHAPFYGWIRDLSAPDPSHWVNLFGLLHLSPATLATVAAVPVIGSFMMIGAWPLIMGVTMYLQQKLNPQPVDPMQAKMFLALPIVFTYMLAAFPAGLVIYWAWNNLLSVAQQWAIMHRAGAA
ncbi:MAG TPA: membrane protein insertase YidC [Stellaceae bacterium]|nr:membrane protein insertase YidC [Stellaceae bacterium]